MRRERPASGTGRLLAEHWNGSAWSIVAICISDTDCTAGVPTSPRWSVVTATAVPGAGASALNGVAALTATEYAAVGSSSSAVSGRTLVEARS
jgi:hypothetical protein